MPLLKKHHTPILSWQEKERQRRRLRTEEDIRRLKILLEEVTEDGKKSAERNAKLKKDIKRVEDHGAALEKKSQDLKLKKKQYENYLLQKYPKWIMESMYGSKPSYMKERREILEEVLKQSSGKRHNKTQLFERNDPSYNDSNVNGIGNKWRRDSTAFHRKSIPFVPMSTSPIANDHLPESPGEILPNFGAFFTSQNSRRITLNDQPRHFYDAKGRILRGPSVQRITHPENTSRNLPEDLYETFSDVAFPSRLEEETRFNRLQEVHDDSLKVIPQVMALSPEGKIVLLPMTVPWYDREDLSAHRTATKAVDKRADFTTPERRTPDGDFTPSLPVPHLNNTNNQTIIHSDFLQSTRNVNDMELEPLKNTFNQQAGNIGMKTTSGNAQKQLESYTNLHPNGSLDQRQEKDDAFLLHQKSSYLLSKYSEDRLAQSPLKEVSQTGHLNQSEATPSKESSFGRNREAETVYNDSLHVSDPKATSPCVLLIETQENASRKAEKQLIMDVPQRFSTEEPIYLEAGKTKNDLVYQENRPTEIDTDREENTIHGKEQVYSKSLAEDSNDSNLEFSEHPLHPKKETFPCKKDVEIMPKIVSEPQNFQPANDNQYRVLSETRKDQEVDLHLLPNDFSSVPKGDNRNIMEGVQPIFEKLSPVSNGKEDDFGGKTSSLQDATNKLDVKPYEQDMDKKENLKSSTVLGQKISTLDPSDTQNYNFKNQGSTNEDYVLSSRSFDENSQSDEISEHLPDVLTGDDKSYSDFTGNVDSPKSPSEQLKSNSPLHLEDDQRSVSRRLSLDLGSVSCGSSDTSTFDSDAPTADVVRKNSAQEESKTGTFKGLNTVLTTSQSAKKAPDDKNNRSVSADKLGDLSAKTVDPKSSEMSQFSSDEGDENMDDLLNNSLGLSRTKTEAVDRSMVDFTKKERNSKSPVNDLSFRIKNKTKKTRPLFGEGNSFGVDNISDHGNADASFSDDAVSEARVSGIEGSADTASVKETNFLPKSEVATRELTENEAKNQDENTPRSAQISKDEVAKSISQKIRKPGFWDHSDSDPELDLITNKSNMKDEADDEDFDFEFYN